MYPKDTEKWKQFTTVVAIISRSSGLLCIPKILKNESNSQRSTGLIPVEYGCCVSQRYWKMKAIHNNTLIDLHICEVVVYPKDTEKWKQFTTKIKSINLALVLLCIPKILKNESNSQPFTKAPSFICCCCVSQRYWKMKAIHNTALIEHKIHPVVVYPKDTEKWKQFTTSSGFARV